MKSIVPGFFLLGLSAWAAAAEQPEIQVELPEGQQVYEGDAVLYRVTLSNVENPSPPKLVGFDDFTIESRGEQVMDSRQLEFRNGRPVEIARQSRIYDYLLTPKRTGELTIPAPTADVQGRVLRGQSLKLRVIAPQDQDLALLEIRVDQPAVYPTQTLTVTLSIAVKALPEPFAERDPVAVLRRLPALSIPWVADTSLPAGIKPEQTAQAWLEGLLNRRRGGGFSVNNVRGSSGFLLFDEGPLPFLPPAQRTHRLDRAGQSVSYWEYAFPRTFVAQRVGQFSLGPVSLKGTLGGRLTAGGELGLEAVFAVAKPVTVTVQDAPQEGRPASYAGVIGEFEFQGQLSPTTVKVGDPMTLTLTLRGQGTLEAVKPPDLAQVPDLAKQFKIYEVTDATAGAERRFTYSLRPLTAAAKTFPAVPLAAYFDVKQETFVTLQTEAIPVEITQAEQLDSQQIALARTTQSAGQEIEAQEGGIFANDVALGSLRDESVQPGRWFVALGSLTGAYGVILLITRRSQRLSGDPLLRRRRTAVARAQQRLQAAKGSSGSRQEADALQAAIVGLVADAAGLTEAGLTSAEVCLRLLQMQLEPALVERVSAWFEACDAARYGASQQALHGLEDTASALLEALVKSLRQKRLLQSTTRLLLVALLAATAGCARVPDPALSQKFQAAQQAFDKAQAADDFLRAAGLYQEILDTGLVSGAVLYNQGNAFLRGGQRGRAIACYRQAQRYRPRDALLDHNLGYTLGPGSAKPQHTVLDYLLFWQDWIGYGDKFRWLAAAGLVTFALAVAALYVQRQRVVARVAVVALWLTLVLAASAAYDWFRFEAIRRGVLTADGVVARKGNAESYEPAFTQPLPEGTEFQVLERRDDWLLIRLPGAKEGWVTGDRAVVY
ncbi:MAG: BatD family protein [Planctomycetota bacterium]|nr:BatD family protein [Planctomycetota bacterium]